MVLDLTGPREFDLANRGNKLVVTVLPPRAGSPANGSFPSPTAKPEAPATLAQTAAPEITPVAIQATATPVPAFASPVQAASANTATATLQPAGAAFADETGVPAVTEKAAKKETAPPPQPAKAPAAPATPVSAIPVPATPVMAKASYTDSAQKAQAAAPQASPAVQNGASGQARLVPATLSTTEGQANGAQKGADYVFVTPDFKKQDAAQASAVTPDSKKQATTAADPVGTRANEAATTIAQAQPPVLTAQAQPQTPPAPQPATNLALEQQKASATPAPPAAAKKYTGEPISVNLKDVDLKDFFRLIHEISGLNIVLDPNVKGTLTLVLDDVPWDQALDVVLHNNGLGRELEGSILRIAALDTFRKEAEEQRARTDALALAVNTVTVTRFLSYGRAKDVMPTIKKLLTKRGEVLADDRTNALIINDIPSILPGLDRLITQLDRKTMQVEIEARVVSATRNFAQQFGTQLGFAWGNGSTSVGGNPSTGYSHANLYVVFGGVPVLHQQRQPSRCSRTWRPREIPAA